jgi:Zn-dependent M16 (insulinase) family peptidase
MSKVLRPFAVVMVLFLSTASIIGSFKYSNAILKKVKGGSRLYSSVAAVTLSVDPMSIAHPAYDQQEKFKIDEYGLEGILYTHRKSGAQVISVLAPQDDNKVFGITFRTPPEDSTGIPHVLEHSVLCGSKKFPVKEPFVDLLKGSLQNFLNAFTYPDRTCYPVASTNTKDFYNLVNVYLDAVLNPRAISDPLVLSQEGWHYELEDPDSPLIFKGVVYNEMKGVYSSPDSLMGRATQQALFPSNTYGVDSGGDPLKIPDLTFDQFKAFHSDYYHPCNSRVFFYGNDDPQKRLTLLDEYLQDFDAKEVNSKVQFQPKFTEPKRVEVKFPISPNTEPKHMITCNWLLNEGHLSSKEMFGLAVLDTLLLGNSASPLRKILTESQLGESVTGGGLSDELLQSTFSAGMKGVKPENVQKVEELVLSTLTKLSGDGFDQAAIDSAMNTFEFRLREFNTGSFPRGLSVMLGMMSHWIYDKNPVDGVAFEAPLKELKEDLAAGKPVFQDLLKRYIVDNNHRVTVEAKPDLELENETVKEEVERLAGIKACMTSTDIERIIEETRVLKEAQEAIDSPAAKASLPRLGLEDIDPVCKVLPIEILNNNADGTGATIITHDLQTNGILYADVAFDYSSVSVDDLDILSLFSRMLMETGTATLDEAGLAYKIGTNTGGISVSYINDLKAGNGKIVDSNDVSLYLMIRGKAVQDSIPQLFELFGDILMTAKLDNQKRAIEMLKESKIRKENSIVSAGHSYGAARLAGRQSFLGYLGEVTGGLTSVRAAGSLLEMAEKDWPKLQARLENLRSLIVRKGDMIVNLTGEKKVIDTTLPAMESFLTFLPAAPAVKSTNSVVKSFDKSKLMPMQDEGFSMATQVNYVVSGGQIMQPGEDVKGSSSVITRYLSIGHLWDNVRVIGGAYGGFARFSEATGRFVFMSYRDPNLLKTLEIYDSAADSLLESELSSEDLLQAIVGAVGEIDGPLSPDQKGFTSFLQHLSGESQEERQNWRTEILSASNQDFKEFANKLKGLRDTGSICVFGSQTALDAANKALPADKQLLVEQAIRS